MIVINLRSLSDIQQTSMAGMKFQPEFMQVSSALRWIIWSPFQGSLESVESTCKACESQDEEEEEEAGSVEVIVTNETTCTCPASVILGSPQVKKGNDAQCFRSFYLLYHQPS